MQKEDCKIHIDLSVIENKTVLGVNENRAVPELRLDRISDIRYPIFIKVSDTGYRISDRTPDIQK